MTNNHWGGYNNYDRMPPPSSQYDGYYPQRSSAGDALARYSDRRSAPKATSGLEGRMIDSPKDITPDEVPMNGSLAVFPLNDLSVIYAKAWTDKGIVTVPYVPEQPVQTQPAPVAYIPEEFKTAMFERLDKIEQALAQVTQKPVKASKKEEQPNG